jgi:hypothetical protein
MGRKNKQNRNIIVASPPPPPIIHLQFRVFETLNPQALVVGFTWVEGF